jgi:hypothetical protein
LDRGIKSCAIDEIKTRSYAIPIEHTKMLEIEWREVLGREK